MSSPCDIKSLLITKVTGKTCSQTRGASKHSKEHELGNLPKTYMRVE
jgi:hypothetical protein